MFSTHTLFLSAILLSSTVVRATKVSTTLYSNKEFTLEEISTGLNFTTVQKLDRVVLLAEARVALLEGNAALHMQRNKAVDIPAVILADHQTIDNDDTTSVLETVGSADVSADDQADVQEEEDGDADKQTTAGIALACFVLLQLFGSSKTKKQQ